MTWTARLVANVARRWIRSMAEKPPLVPGATWGPDLKMSDIRVGDSLYIFGTASHSSVEGTIKKINPKNIKLDMGDYKRPGDMVIDVDKARLRGAYVIRGKIVHEIKG